MPTLERLLNIVRSRHRPGDGRSKSRGAARFAACATMALLFGAREVDAQHRATALDASPSRDAVRVELQRIEARVRGCGAVRVDFVARIVVASSGRGASFEVFTPADRVRASRDVDMRFDRHPPPGQKAGGRLTGASRACVLRELQSFQVPAFSRSDFVVVALMEIAHTASTPW
jgi:hypothetical protein